MVQTVHPAQASAPRGAGPAVLMHHHWPEYLIEALYLGLFMISACTFALVFEHPASPVRQLIEPPALRRIPMGLAMGLTAVALIYSPLGKRSGAHMNPATTLAFFRLGKVRGSVAAGYIGAQVAGGIIGVFTAATLLGAPLADPAVNYVTTLPGMLGHGVAWVAELSISCLMMLMVLTVSNSRFARWTGLCAGVLVMLFIIVEAPLSGMSLNPARSLGSAVAANVWSGFWVYLTAPPLGMLLAAELYTRLHGARAVRCAKLAHPSTGPCLFSCAYAHAARQRSSGALQL